MITSAASKPKMSSWHSFEHVFNLRLCLEVSVWTSVLSALRSRVVGWYAMRRLLVYKCHSRKKTSQTKMRLIILFHWLYLYVIVLVSSLQLMFSAFMGRFSFNDNDQNSKAFAMCIKIVFFSIFDSSIFKYARYHTLCLKGRLQEYNFLLSNPWTNESIWEGLKCNTRRSASVILQLEMKGGKKAFSSRGFEIMNFQCASDETEHPIASSMLFDIISGVSSCSLGRTKCLCRNENKYRKCWKIVEVFWNTHDDSV